MICILWKVENFKVENFKEICLRDGGFHKTVYKRDTIS